MSWPNYCSRPSFRPPISIQGTAFPPTNRHSGPTFPPTNKHSGNRLSAHQSEPKSFCHTLWGRKAVARGGRCTRCPERDSCRPSPWTPPRRASSSRSSLYYLWESWNIKRFTGQLGFITGVNGVLYMSRFVFFHKKNHPRPCFECVTLSQNNVKS